MKKSIIFILSVLFLAGSVFGQGLGFQAREEGGKLIITGYVGKEQYLPIPPSANGMPIVGIEKEAFFNKGLKSVTIPDSVTSIGDAAFANNQLTKVNIGSGVTTIGVRAFANNQLTAIAIPDSVTSIGESAFANNNQLSSVTLGNKVRDIGKFAFSASILTSITLPNSVVSVGEEAFSGTKLTSITIGANVKLERASFLDSFINSYKGVAGTYTRPNSNSTTWTRGLITF